MNKVIAKHLWRKDHEGNPLKREFAAIVFQKNMLPKAKHLGQEYPHDGWVIAPTESELSKQAAAVEAVKQAAAVEAVNNNTALIDRVESAFDSDSLINITVHDLFAYAEIRGFEAKKQPLPTLFKNIKSQYENIRNKA